MLHGDLFFYPMTILNYYTKFPRDGVLTTPNVIYKISSLLTKNTNLLMLMLTNMNNSFVDPIVYIYLYANM